MSTGSTCASSVAANLSVTAGGAITQSGAATVVGTAGFSACAQAITLTQGNYFQGAVTASNSGANDVAVTDTNALTIGGTVGRDLTISAGATTLAATTVGGALSVTATGAIQDSGTLAVSGEGQFVTKNDTPVGITLANANSTFGNITARTLNAAGDAAVAGGISITENADSAVTQVQTARRW